MESNKVFKFADNGMLRSIGRYLLPMRVAGKNWDIDLDIRLKHTITDVERNDARDEDDNRS